ncbi:MAG TPA: hypothetical protein VI248_05420 [Kineosporiaceae bacterium]
MVMERAEQGSIARASGSEPSSGTAAKPSVRQIFRPEALEHYEQWGDDFISRRENRLASISWWQRLVIPLLAAITLSGWLAITAMVPRPTVGAILTVILPRRGPAGVSVVAIYPPEAAGLLRAGTTVNLPIASTSSESGTGVSTRVTGTGMVLSERQLRARYPVLARYAVPQNAVVGEGILPSTVEIPSAPVVLVGTGLISG